MDVKAMSVYFLHYKISLCQNATYTCVEQDWKVNGGIGLFLVWWNIAENGTKRGICWTKSVVT